VNVNNPFSVFDQVLCISLARCVERRAHIQREFNRMGISQYRFIDAFDKSSDEVIQLYESDFVKKYPPCFRCDMNECDCTNKSLFHPQIGNWLSHMAAWKLAQRAGGKLTLVCEDDVVFRPNTHQSLAMLRASGGIAANLETGQPVLIRLGWALSEDHEQTSAPRLTQDLRNANCCYAINPAMAKLLLKSLHKMETTSDIYVHRIIGKDVCHYTVMPPPVHELSWSTGELLSEIRPKHKYVERLRKRLAELEPGEEEYQEIASQIQREENRLKEFQEYNESPSHNYKEHFSLI